MSASISSQVVSLGNLLRTGDTYIVPPYQRNYAWEEQQYGIFWSDIAKTFSGEAAEYFLGSVVISNSQPPSQLIIDGQQRLITTSVLISALRCHLRNQSKTSLASLLETNLLAKPSGKRPPSPRLALNKSNKAFYDGNIYPSRPHAELYQLAADDSLAPSNRLLAECFRFMHAKITGLCGAGWRLEKLAEAIVEALSRRVFVIRIDVKDDYNAFVLFETLNDRGLELSEADLLRNHLFSIAGERLDETQSNWEMMEENLGHERLIKFIRHHWNSTRGQISERDLYWDIKRLVAAPDAAAAYTESLSIAAEHYAALNNPRHQLWASFSKDEETQIRRHLECNVAMRSEQLFIVLLAALEADRRQFSEILKMLVSFTFRYSTICNLSASNLLQPFVNAAQYIRQNGGAAAADIFAKFLSKLYPDDSQFHSAFSRRSLRKGALARYILAEINACAGAGAKLREPEDPAGANLEHILPQRFSLAWEASRRDFPGGLEKYIHRLGNMTLLPAKLNRELGNTDFSAKKKIFALDCLDITRPVLEASKWSAEEISRRQNWMAGLALKIWRYPAG